DDLALGDGYRVAAVRMGNEDLGDDVRELLEEARVVLQVHRDVVCVHPLQSPFWFGFVHVVLIQAAGISHSPSNTVVAGPVIATGVPEPCQQIVSHPPRVSTRTLESSKPRRMPVTTAAHAPVPHDNVSPAPRSHTRNRMVARSTTCM